jgi:predicted ATPase/DNA-binding SARP family transcriptional activator/Tfp pilus assembly protein PilF
MSVLTLLLLGTPEVRHAARPATFATRKAMALLIYLALEGGMHSREKLTALFWPESDAERGRMALRRTLAYVRDALGEAADHDGAAHMLVERGALGVDPALVESDLQAVHTAWAQARLAAPVGGEGQHAAVIAQLQRAAERYRGDFLDGFSLSDAPAFDEWAAVQRELWHRRAGLVYERLAQLQLAEGDLTLAQETTARWIAHYPLNEEAHRHLMRIHLAAGDRPSALRAYAACRSILAAELGAAPSPETEALAAQIREAAPARPRPHLGVPQSSRPPPARRRHPSLPAPATAVVGREDDVAAVRRTLLSPSARLLTLVGPPGIGKTRLAIQVAEEAGDIADDACFVALATISDHSLVAPTIAQTLGVREEQGAPLIAQLKAALYGRRLLLVLDNFEQVQGAAVLVSELLSAAPWLKVLVTSRSALHIYGEHEYPVAPIRSPDLARLPVLAALAEVPAVQLFLQRARAVRPDLALTEANAPTVAEICVRLEGMPLAIELAAARARTLDLPAILRQLGNPLALLVGGPRDRLARQQTLRGAIAWSYDLLEPAERAVFAQLGVFLGGWSPDAAAAICLPDSPAAEIDTAHALERLADASLARREAGVGGRPRYTLLVAIRQYALELAGQGAAVDELRRRHADYYLGLAERFEPDLGGPQQGALLDELEQEHDNMRAALDWALSGAQSDLALRLCATLWWFWFVRGHLGEGRRWIEAALAKNESSGHPDRNNLLRARLLNAAGVLAHDQGDYAWARARLAEGLDLSRQIGHERGVASGLNNLGLVARSQGDYAQAAVYYQQSLDLCRERGDDWSVAVSLSNLGLVASYQGQYERASAWYAESLALRQRMGDKRGIAVTLNHLGHIVYRAGDYARAAAYHEESLALQRELVDRAGVTDSLVGLGRVALARADYAQAQRHFEAGLAMRRDLGDRAGVAECLEQLAEVAARDGGARRAAVLLGRAQALRDEVGAPRPPLDLPEHARLIADLRAALGEDAFAAAWVEGQAA